MEAPITIFLKKIFNDGAALCYDEVTVRDDWRFSEWMNLRKFWRCLLGGCPLVNLERIWNLELFEEPKNALGA